MIGLFICVCILAVLLFETQVKKEVLSSVEREFQDASQRLKQTLTTSISQSNSDIRFLHATPPISGLPRAFYNDGIDPYDGTTFQQWKERLEIIFIGFMENNLAVEQLRIIEVSALGKELIRVQRRGAAVEAVPDFSLQPKAEMSYFLPSSQLEASQIYLSPLSLNREFGEITFPYKPTLRFSVPIYSKQGKRFGFLIMNINANTLIENLKATVFDYSQLVISSAEGDIIYHPIEKYRFSRDLSPDTNWHALYEQPLIYNVLYFLNSRENDAEQYYGLSYKVQTRTGTKYNFVDFTLLAPEQHIYKLINNKRVSTYSFLGIIILFTLVLLFIFQRNAARSQMVADARKESSAIVDGSIDAIIGLNLEGKLTSVNYTAEHLLSASRNTSLGKGYEELVLLNQFPIKDYINDLKENKPQVKDERLAVIFDKPYYFAISVSPVFSEYRELSGLALIVRDISKEKEAEVKVKRLNSELEAKVRERTFALAQAKDQAIKNSDIKSAFIANISNELRTPLKSIIGSLNRLKHESLSGNSKSLLMVMEQSTTHLNLLINDILDLSQIEAGNLELNLSQFNPRELIERLVESCSVSAFDKGLEVYLDTSELHCHHAFADTLRLTQIINNLISNAIKFTINGFIKITVSSKIIDPHKVTLSVSVEDTGLGIDKKTFSHLFEAFNHVDNSISAESGRTGLGLAICKQLCQMMEGDIEVKSTLNEGSVFSFHVQIDSQGNENIIESQAYDAKNVLIINNNKDTREFIGELIERQGGNVTLHTFDEIEQLHVDAFDFAFLDMKDNTMGQFNQVISLFKQQSSQLDIVVLHQPSEPIPKNLEATVFKLCKPVHHSNLLSAAGGGVVKITQQNKNIELAGEGYKFSPQFIEQLDGCHILVVDDSDINIGVACDALASLPVKINTASNGVEAITKLTESGVSGQPISCMLMDCEMPILDGYQACKKIRLGEAGDLFKDIPIIAMTANEMVGDKHRCLSFGMNDYIEKPIQASELQRKLIKWALSNYENLKLALNERALQKEVLWDREATLSRLLNKEILLEKICRMFTETAPKKFNELKKLLDEKDYEQVRQVAHSLKGLCGELSASTLRQAFSEIELQAKSGQLNVDEQIAFLDENLPKLLSEMKTLYK